MEEECSKCEGERRRGRKRMLEGKKRGEKSERRDCSRKDDDGKDNDENIQKRREKWKRRGGRVFKERRVGLDI